MNFTKMENVVKKNMPFKPVGPFFSNLDVNKKSKVSFVKGRNDTKNLNPWLEGKVRKLQSEKYSQGKVHEAYVNYLNDSLNGSMTSQELVLKVFKWKEVKVKKVDVS